MLATTPINTCLLQQREKSGSIGLTQSHERLILGKWRVGCLLKGGNGPRHFSVQICLSRRQKALQPQRLPLLHRSGQTPVCLWGSDDGTLPPLRNCTAV